MNKIGLVLEGGGMRGAYTAGALAWLIDNNIDFDYGVGISSGAVHICSYFLKNSEYLYDIGVTYPADKRNVGIIPLIKEGRYVGYGFMFDYLLKEKVKYNIKALKQKNINVEVGLYDLELGKTFFEKVDNLDDDLKMLKATCTLPIAGKTVEYNGRKLLDAGIEVMIPYERSVLNNNSKHFVIVTKPEGYVRKQAGSFMKWLMKVNYPKYPIMQKQYANRHLAYNDQMSKIEDGVNKGNTYLVRPSINIPVKRFSGDIKSLDKLYKLGYSDMEKQKENILKFIKEVN